MDVTDDDDDEEEVEVDTDSEFTDPALGTPIKALHLASIARDRHLVAGSGTKGEGPFTVKQTQWFHGRVAAVLGGGHISVEYDDGDKEDDVWPAFWREI